jgi:hypothetical protein
MCPVCIANAAVMVAGAGSTGGILAVYVGKFRRCFQAHRLHVSVVRDKKRANHFGLIQKGK